jgi:hypothetical protein
MRTIGAFLIRLGLWCLVRQWPRHWTAAVQQNEADNAICLEALERLNQRKMEADNA